MYHVTSSVPVYGNVLLKVLCSRQCGRLIEDGGFIGGMGTLRENWFITTVCSSDRVVITSLLLKSAKRVNRVKNWE